MQWWWWWGSLTILIHASRQSNSRSSVAKSIAGHSSPTTRQLIYSPGEYEMGPRAVDMKSSWSRAMVGHMCIDLKDMFGAVMNPDLLPPCLMEVLKEIGETLDGATLMMAQVFRYYYHGLLLKSFFAEPYKLEVSPPSTWFQETVAEPKNAKKPEEMPEKTPSAPELTLSGNKEFGVFAMEMSNNSSSNLSVNNSLSPNHSAGAHSPFGSTDGHRNPLMTSTQALQILRRREWIQPKEECLKDEIAHNGKVGGTVSRSGYFTLVDDYRDSVEGVV